MKSKRTAGFTLIELLVILSILTLIISFILGAVVQARSSARRLSCQNNLRQIGTALLEFEAAQGRFPGVYCGIVGTQKPPSVLWSFSPSSLIASSLDGQALADRVQVSQPVTANDPDWLKSSLPSPAVLRCPDDGLATGIASSYRYCRGVLALWPQDPGGVFVRNDEGVTAAQVIDGLSNTAFSSERLINDPTVYSSDQARGLLVFDASNTPDISIACWNANLTGSGSHPWSTEPSGMAWMSGRWLNASYYHLFPPNSRWRDCRLDDQVAMAVVTARSGHQGGVNLLLGDGSVRFVSNSINLPVWRALATRSGNDSSGEF